MIEDSQDVRLTKLILAFYLEGALWKNLPLLQANGEKNRSSSMERETNASQI